MVECQFKLAGKMFTELMAKGAENAVGYQSLVPQFGTCSEVFGAR